MMMILVPILALILAMRLVSFTLFSYSRYI